MATVRPAAVIRVLSRIAGPGLGAPTGGGCPAPAGCKGAHRETADHRPAFRRRACGRACQGGARPPRGRDRLRQQPAERMATFVRACRHGEGDRTPCRQGGPERSAASVARAPAPVRSRPGGAATPGIPRACMAGGETRQRADRVFFGRRRRRAGLASVAHLRAARPGRTQCPCSALPIPMTGPVSGVGCRAGTGRGRFARGRGGQTPPSVPAVRIRPCLRRQLALVMRP